MAVRDKSNKALSTKVNEGLVCLEYNDRCLIKTTYCSSLVKAHRIGTIIMWCFVDSCLSFFFSPLCSILFRFTDPDYPVGIFKHFLSRHFDQQFWRARIALPVYITIYDIFGFILPICFREEYLKMILSRKQIICIFHNTQFYTHKKRNMHVIQICLFCNVYTV